MHNIINDTEMSFLDQIKLLIVIYFNVRCTARKYLAQTIINNKYHKF